MYIYNCNRIFILNNVFSLYTYHIGLLFSFFFFMYVTHSVNSVNKRFGFYWFVFGSGLIIFLLESSVLSVATVVVVAQLNKYLINRTTAAVSLTKISCIINGRPRLLDFV